MAGLFGCSEKVAIFALSEMTTRKFPWRGGTTDNHLINRPRRGLFIFLYILYKSLSQTTFQFVHE